MCVNKLLCKTFHMLHVNVIRHLYKVIIIIIIIIIIMHVNQNVRHILLYSYFSFPYISSSWLWIVKNNNYWSFSICTDLWVLSACSWKHWRNLCVKAHATVNSSYSGVQWDSSHLYRHNRVSYGVPFNIRKRALFQYACSNCLVAVRSASTLSDTYIIYVRILIMSVY